MADRRSPALPARRMKAKECSWFTLLILCLLIVVPVSGTVFTYDKNTSGGSVQDLINGTANGDSIYLAGGRYPGDLTINRSIVFGALDTNNPPEIVSSDGSDAGITLAADGITINGVIISGGARCGLLVKSGNNQVRDVTVRGFSLGVGLESAQSTIFAENTLVNNTVGIDLDPGSRSNTFYLNTLDNSRDVHVASSGNIWSSGSQVYQYRGKEYTGRVGNFWSRYNGTDANGDGIGDTAYSIESGILAAGGQGGSPGGPALVSGAGDPGLADLAPLASSPQSYTLVSVAAGPFNTSANGGLPGQPPFSGIPQTGVPQQGFLIGQGNPPQSGTNQFLSQGAAPGNPFFPFLLQYWWVIPPALAFCVIAGIWLGRRWRHSRPVPPGTGGAGESLRNVTVVKTTVPPAADASQDRLHYAAHLPAALERKYPGAEYVAEGGVSRVFRAWDEREGREVAVKIPIRFDEVTGTQFTKELHVWEGLHHTNIVEIYAANIFPVPYIEMEYVSSSLTDLKFPLETKRATGIVRGIAEGLRYAHDQGIVHRDIKPGNILITADGTPKISDWGLSKAEGTKQSGIIGFSLEYAAPEQLAPNLYGEPGPWTDIYQLGVLFYEMLSGYVPFRGDGMGEVTQAILHDDPRPLDLTGPDAALIGWIVMRCLSKRPEDRYRSVTGFLDDLKKAGF